MPPTIHVNKAPGGQLAISWSPSCSQDAVDYAIYQGAIGAWSSHTALDCTDDAGTLVETITPSPSSSYYLVVALGADGEGSYGTDSSSGERPRGASTCAASRIVTSCPP